MCTLTAVRAPGGARVAFNRDESPARAPALPPVVVRVGERGAAFPVDPESGGTWLAATDAGLVLAVLNVNTGRKRAAMPRASRGTVVPALIEANSPWDAVFAVERAVDVSGLAPFRLVAVDREAVADFRWDGRATAIGSQLLSAGPALFTSSGLGDDRVAGARGDLFRALFACPPELWPDAQDTFHRHRWPERPELSVNMERAAARTVSTAVIELSGSEVRFSYRRAAPHEPAAPHELVLPLAAGVRP
jgi:hypothetical protein